MEVRSLAKTLSCIDCTVPPTLTKRVLCLWALLLGSFVPLAYAQDVYPSRPVKIIVGAPPGPPVDIVNRVLAASLSTQLGQSFVVENKGGASGFIGLEYVAQSQPDGYTLFAGGLGGNVLPSVIFKNLPFDPLKKFVPVAFVGGMFNVFIVRADSPIKSMADLIKLAKDKPGLVKIGSNATGSGPHMGYALLAQQTGTTWNFIPYKGPNEILANVMSGDLDVGTSQLPSFAGVIQSGKVRVLAVSAANRSKLLPNVPTVAEAGVPGYAVSSWLGLFAPVGTPQPVIDKLSTSLAKTLADPAVSSKLVATGFEPSYEDSQVFDKRIQQDYILWSGVAKRANISMSFGQ